MQTQSHETHVNGSAVALAEPAPPVVPIVAGQPVDRVAQEEAAQLAAAISIIGANIVEVLNKRGQTADAAPRH
jgi:hypothetical protein